MAYVFSDYSGTVKCKISIRKDFGYAKYMLNGNIKEILKSF
jgi:hypothetical protein